MILFLTIFWWMFAILITLSILSNIGHIIQGGKKVESLRPGGQVITTAIASLFAVPILYLEYHGFIHLGIPLWIYWLELGLGFLVSLLRLMHPIKTHFKPAGDITVTFGLTLLYITHVGLKALQ